MPEPINKALYSKAKSAANRKYGAKSSLYKSSYIVHKYISMGGRYRGKRDPHHGIIAAFAKLNKSSRKRKSRKSTSRSRK